MDQPAQFPPQFLWGAATSAYQIEGAAHEDGRSESIWDRFAATPGKTRNGENGDIACDHYHRFEDDISLMRDLGLDAYRFSIAWPRVIPDGVGTINSSGLDFYDRLVDALLGAGIEPVPTLYHWDLPQVLEDQGGWTNRHIVDAFAAYTEAVVRRLGDRVGRWITHNEPWCASWLGYGYGEHAPGRRDTRAALAAAHNLLGSHGRAMEVIRQLAPQARAGITLDLYGVYPASSSDADRAAAHRYDGYRNRWFLDPVLRGSYPSDIAESYGAAMPPIEPGDMEIISAPIDFLGINFYSRHIIQAGPNGEPHVQKPDDGQYTAIGWEVYPNALYDVLNRVQREYNPSAIYVTENGAAYLEARTHDGMVRDPERQEYIACHLNAAERAIADGVKLEGYFVWSLLDNYEWARGYSNRFGLVYVDFPTLERIPKSSFAWYRDFIARQHAAAGTARSGEMALNESA